MKDSYCGPFLLSLVTDLFWSKKIRSFKFLLYKARNSHILSFLHSFYALLLSSIFFFSFPNSRACLFHFFSVFNFVNFSFEWNFHMESLGDWARNRQNTKHALEVAFFPLSCHILWEKLDFVFRKQRFDPGALRRQPHSLESHTWAKFGWRPGRPLQVTEGWAQLTSNSSHCQANTLWRSVLSSYSFSKMPAFLLPGGSCLLWGSGVPLFPTAPCCAGGLCSRDPAGSPSAPSPLWKLPRFTPDWRFKGDHLAFPGDIFHCPAWG